MASSVSKQTTDTAVSIIAEAPEEALGRITLVRLDDTDHPVRLNPFRRRDAEKVLEDIMSVLYEIFDPRHEGIIGPRFERIFRQIMAAQRALLGDDATLTLVPAMLADRDSLQGLTRALAKTDPEISLRPFGDVPTGRQFNHLVPDLLVVCMRSRQSSAPMCRLSGESERKPR